MRRYEIKDTEPLRISCYIAVKRGEKVQIPTNDILSAKNTLEKIWNDIKRLKELLDSIEKVEYLEDLGLVSVHFKDGAVSSAHVYVDSSMAEKEEKEIQISTKERKEEEEEMPPLLEDEDEDNATFGLY